MTLELWFALASVNFAASVAPGQNVALVGNAALRAGLPGGLAAAAGILLAEFAWSLLALTLLLGARELSPALFQGLQVASGASLLWIGVRVLREAPPCVSLRVRGRRGVGRFAFDGVLIGAVNPLALVFFLSLLPGFVPDGIHVAEPGVVAFFVSAVLASSLAGLVPWLAASHALAEAGFARCLQLLCGGTLVALALVVLWRVVA